MAVEAVDPRIYIHPDDKKALKVLKAVPGFALVARAYIHIFGEEPMRLMNLANCVRVSPAQYPGLYDLLPPICERLGIAEPELYVVYNPFPNACSIGGCRKNMILITTGLLDAFTWDSVKAVLAHECGHIACGHSLYQTIARWLFRDLNTLVTVPFPVSEGLHLAAMHWMRCCELSADRASAICVGGSHQVIDVMLQLSDGIMNAGNFDTEEYLRQAEAYRQEAKRTVWNRVVSAAKVMNRDHPFPADRALEIDSWCHSEDFLKIQEAGGQVV